MKTAEDLLIADGLRGSRAVAPPIGEIEQARNNVCSFVRAAAAETAEEIGCTYRPARIAPSSYDDLIREFKLAQSIGMPVRVYDEHSWDTIYDAPETNHAARFFHDSRHVWFQSDFTLEAELFVNGRQLARLERAGFGPETIEYRLYQSDTIGQTLFVAACGSFPKSQLRFALRCLTKQELIDAVHAEIEVERTEAVTA